MLKNWKSLFVKTEENPSAKEDSPGFSFPVTDTNAPEQPKKKKPYPGLLSHRHPMKWCRK